MKICCVAPRFVPSMGKAITFVAKGLAERGHKVTVLSSNLDHSNRIVDEKKEEIKGIRAIRLKAYPFARKLIMPRLIPELMKLKPDGFYLEGLGHFSTTIASWFSRFRKIPSIMRADWSGGEIITSGLKGLYDRYVKFPVLKNVSIITVYTTQQKKKMMELGIDPEKILIMPNGVDYDRFSKAKKNDYLRKKFNIPKKTKIILCIVSRMIPFKNLELAIISVSKLREKGKDASLVITGSKTDKKYYGKLVELISRLRLKDRVFFHPEVEHSKIHEIYASADIFALPSRPEEGMNLSTLEAMASGLPVVTTLVSVTPEWVREAKCGFVSADPDSFVKSLEILVDNEKLRRIMGNNGKEYMKEYSWDRIVDTIEGMFEKLIKN